MPADMDYSDFEEDADFSDENFSPSPAPKAKAKKAAAAKPLAASNVNNLEVAVAPAPAAQKGKAAAENNKSIEEIYQKKTQLEHILLRPDTYIGSTEKQDQQLWVHDGMRMVLSNISYVPGLYKIFDEILVNAADNKVRDPSMDTVKVTIDVATNSIQVWNNGNGVPVEMHKKEGVYVPELIFGHLLTSSNYNDQEEKITGGRNGYGAKLTNIFSTEFTIETCDGSRAKRYKQTFRNNMTVKGEPKITACKPGENWTSVTFRPDLAKFGMETLEADTVALMRKRVYDLAGILGKTCKVYLNGERLSIKSFSDYVDLYLGPSPKEGGPPRVYERVHERWEVCVSPTDGQFQQVSFVNSICTAKGGTHVAYVVDQITKALVEKINKKNKNANVKPFMVKNHLWVFINCHVVNPAFDSQTKENLTLKASAFGSKPVLPDSMIDKIAKSGVVDSILRFASFKNDKDLKKTDGSKRQRLDGIPKLDDANDAGGRNSHNCTLILTEGDSAKALAMSGLSVVGRDNYGVFPLRGKLLNVRDASVTQINGNAEIDNIKKILGLQHGKVYQDVKPLRYGHLMIMTDQDHDGSHIKGLIMNFLHTFYPSLLKIPGFLLEFITPIVKASKGKQKVSFYTMPEYEAWKESLGGKPVGWNIKYYKGLGTSDRKEAQEYFKALDRHRKEFVYTGEEDDRAIEMAFSKKRVEERKEWLSAYVPGTYLDQSAKRIGYSDFINKELILFSRADLERSIPCMLDGLKPGQRKIMFACFKRKLAYTGKDLKVAQLAGYVAEHAAYHHGEQSLCSTIVNLAQDFCGSNNINLLVPSGQFGTRASGGKDASSPRYIFTRMAYLTRHLFNEADEALLKYLNEEGQRIEPEWYMPILPMVLVNGAEGIGTGWSTYIPNYNPRDIVANIKRLLAGEEQVAMDPWFRGFKGVIREVPTKSSGKSYVCSGIVNQVGDAKLDITELPIRKWTQDYKEFLEGLMKPENKDEAPLVLNYDQHHTDLDVHFSVDIVPDKFNEVLAAGLEAKFKLTSRFSTSNMMLFDAEGRIKHYPSPEAIVAEFFDLRLDYYERRRQALLKAAEFQLLQISNRVRFIMAVINGTLRVANRKKAEVEADLAAQGFDRLPSRDGKSKGRAAAGADGEEEAEEGEGEEAAVVSLGASYNYLLSMPIYSLTWEKVTALQEEASECASRVSYLSATSAAVMWSEDLDAFLVAYDEWEAEEERQAQEMMRVQKKARKGGKAAAAAAGKPKKGKKAAASSEEEDEDEISEEEDGDFEEVKPKPAARKPRAPAAPKPAAPAPVLAAKPVAAPAAKPAAGQGSVGMLAASNAAASAQQAAAPAPEAMSLAARLAGRFQKLTTGPAVPPPLVNAGEVGTSSGAPAPTSSVGSLGLTSLQLGNSSASGGGQGGGSGSGYMAELEDSLCSPAPAAHKSRAPPKPKAVAGTPTGKPPLAKPTAAAAAGGAAKRKPAAAKPAGTGAAAGGSSKPRAAAGAGAAKGGARKKKVVSDSEDEESDVTSEEEESEDVYELDAPSPAVAPKGKKSKVGPSPLAMKAMARTAAAAPSAAAAKKPAAAKPKAAAAPAAAPPKAPADEGEDEGEAGGRGQRARRQAKNVSYIEIEDSDEEGGAGAGGGGAAGAGAGGGGAKVGGKKKKKGSDSESDFCLSEEEDD